VPGPAATDILSKALARSGQILVLRDYELCRKLRNRRCRFFAYSQDATAYLTDDGSKLQTAYHEVRDYAERSISRGVGHLKSGTYQVEIPLVLTNTRGQMIYNDLALATFAARNVQEHEEAGSIVLPPFDTVTIQLRKIVGPPLRWARQSLPIGASVYIPGFPIATTGRASYGGDDSDGASLRVAMGQVIGRKAADQKTGDFRATDTQAFWTAYEAIMYFMDADSAPRMSGSPILNSNGEVVGTYLDGFPSDGSTQLNHISYGSNIFSTSADLNTLMQLNP
jgi:hypothetical protein